VPALPPYIHSRSPSGNGFQPCCPSATPTIRSDATALASPRGAFSRSWCRFWSSDAPSRGSPTSLARRARCVEKARRVDRLGGMERIREICLEAYDRLIGLELSEMAVDCCTT
jgi:hypothetical protein